MICEQVRELLSAYLDDRLVQKERQQIATHLQSCAECRNMLADFRRFDALLTQLPRIKPDTSLYKRIFSSPEYLDLLSTFDTVGRIQERIIPPVLDRQSNQDYPSLASLPDNLPPPSSPAAPSLSLPKTPFNNHHHSQSLRRTSSTRRILLGALAAALLLTVALGSFLGWQLRQKGSNAIADAPGITPPAGLSSGPIPAGQRFVFLRDGALWSAPTDGSAGITRLSPNNVTVADSWAVRTPLPGHPAGNLIAYIDLQQGYVHTIRSDGQSDTVIPQPLLKRSTSLSSLRETEVGTAILNGLSWSKDGNMLAFVADPAGSGQTELFLYSPGTRHIHQVTLPLRGAVSQPVWSPDGVRVAFKFSYNGKTGILDYNTHNDGVFTIVPAVSTTTNPRDTVLALDWSPNPAVPTVTWSVGVTGHLHSIWSRRVGIGIPSAALELVSGDYVEASYSKVGHGNWLLVTSSAGLRGDAISLDLTGTTRKLTSGKQVNTARWSPDGSSIDYFDTLSSGMGTLHVISASTDQDTQIATSVVSAPAPVWSPDGQHLAYSSDSRVQVINTPAGSLPPDTSPQLKTQGSVTALSWSTVSPQQLVMAIHNGQQGIYLFDIKKGTLIQIDKESTNGPIEWTQIP